MEDGKSIPETLHLNPFIDIYWPLSYRSEITDTVGIYATKISCHVKPHYLTLHLNFYVAHYDDDLREVILNTMKEF